MNLKYNLSAVEANVSVAFLPNPNVYVLQLWIFSLFGEILRGFLCMHESRREGGSIPPRFFSSEPHQSNHMDNENWMIYIYVNLIYSPSTASPCLFANPYLYLYLIIKAVTLLSSSVVCAPSSVFDCAFVRSIVSVFTSLPWPAFHHLCTTLAMRKNTHPFVSNRCHPYLLSLSDSVAHLPPCLWRFPCLPCRHSAPATST
jgi:hypothetical protein